MRNNLKWFAIEETFYGFSYFLGQLFDSLSTLLLQLCFFVYLIW